MTSIASSLTSAPTTLALFDRACALVAARGRGLTLRDLSTCSALGRALVSRDEERVQDFTDELGIEVEALR